MPAGTLRMVRAMACAYDAHRIHTDGVRGGGTEKGSAMTAMPPNDRFDRFDRFSKLVPRFDHLKWKMAAAGILVGLISGFLVVLYRLGIEYGTDTARWIYARIRETPWLVAPWAVAAIAAALAIAWMVKKEPMAGGSGIPQTNGVVICGLKMRWQTILPVRFIGGLLGSLFGLSLGREGPSIHIGASGAQILSHRLRGKKREDVQEHYLVTAGAAAGLSAAFSAPLSGMMFALEGVHRSFSPAILMGATAASLTADFVSKYCFGLRPVLDFGTIGQLPLGEYGWLIPLGLVAGLVGSLMNRSLLGFQTLYGKLPAWSRPLIAIALALPIGIWLPDVLGGGSNLIAMAEHARVGLGMLCVLFVTAQDVARHSSMHPYVIFGGAWAARVLSRDFGRTIVLALSPMTISEIVTRGFIVFALSLSMVCLLSDNLPRTRKLFTYDDAAKPEAPDNTVVANRPHKQAAHSESSIEQAPANAQAAQSSETASGNTSANASKRNASEARAAQGTESEAPGDAPNEASSIAGGEQAQLPNHPAAAQPEQPQANPDQQVRDWLRTEHGLTAREIDVALLIAHGRSKTFIANELFISENTVRTHSKNVYAKLGIHSREELISLFENRLNA